MSRHTTFKFCLDPTIEQCDLLAGHAGASRFAFNQCLRHGEDRARRTNYRPGIAVPWTGFDLINAFNAWKKTEDAGRVFTVDTCGVTEAVVTGLVWRTPGVSASVRGSRRRPRQRAEILVGLPIREAQRQESGLPPFQEENRCGAVISVAQQASEGPSGAIRVGDHNRPRSVTLPGIGPIAVHDDTRCLRRMLAKGRAKILFATISHHGGRWWVSLNVEAADLHPAQQHPARHPDDRGGWVGVDRGLSAFLVAATADGEEVARIADAPKALAAGMKQQRRLAKKLSRTKNGSRNRRDAAAKLGRHHNHVANVRRHFLHWVSNELVKTHDRLVIEDLNVSGMLRNRHLALSYLRRWLGRVRPVTGLQAGLARWPARHR